MDTLHTLVHSLTKEEIRFYKLYSQRYATGTDGLSNRLLDLIRHAEAETAEEELFTTIYGAQGNKNNYYRLKNRLQEDLCDTLAVLHFDKHSANALHRLICVYNILYEKGKHELAFYFLRKAEKKAEQTENYELLDLIYSSLIKLSKEVLAINPEAYITKQSHNAQLLNRVRQMDQVLAALNYRIKVTQNFQKGNETILKLVEKTVRDFSKDKSIKENRGFQIKIYRAISQTMVQKMKYKELEPFLLKTYSTFESKNWFDRSTHDMRLQLLVYLANTLFKNRKFEQSLKYAQLLGQDIVKFDKLYYDKYLFFYYNALVVNYSQTDSVKALATLDAFEKNNMHIRNSYYEQFIHANRAMFLFNLKRYSDSIRSIVKLYVNSHYKEADRSFKLRVEVSEAILQYESGDTKTAIRRIKQIRKTYIELLQEESFTNDHTLLEILHQMALTDSKILAPKLTKKIKQLIAELVHVEEETTYAINYLDWLAPKVGLDALKLVAKQRR